MPTREIANSEFADYIARRRMDYNGQSLLYLEVPGGGGEDASGVNFGMVIESGRLACLRLVCPNDTMLPAIGEHWLAVDGTGGGSERRFDFRISDQSISPVDARTRKKTEPVKPLEIPEIAPRVPEDVDCPDVTEMISRHDPRRVIFYTGAGMSNAGDVPVPDYPSLTKQLGIVDVDSPVTESEDSLQTNADFLAGLLSDERKCMDAASIYGSFVEALYADAGTPAHEALGDMVQWLERLPTIITTNIDVKHEAEGSRLIPSRLVPGWERSQFSGASEAVRQERLRLREELIALSVDPCLLVVIGVANNRRRFFDFLAANNPATKIVAINESEEHPPYPTDFLLRADAHQALPDIRDAMMC